MNKIKVLDCTLRDGGYVNDWNFGINNIKRILTHLISAEIDIIECGYLSNKQTYDPNRSIFDTIERLSEVIPSNRKNCKFVSMINYGEYNVDDIPEYDGTSVDGIRVVFHKKELDGAIEFCKNLAKKGYMLFIQPMVTINYTDSELLLLVEQVNDINPYAFYIVDSFGVMKKKDLMRMFYLIDNNLNKSIKIGYHSHNNLQLAYSNAQSLVEINTKRIKIIDSSVFGMGRGAGNLNTELFIEYLNEFYDKRYKVYPLLQIIDETLNKIYYESYWGYTLPHYLSSKYNCNPNYATYLSDKNTLSIKSISEILGEIPDDRKVRFDKQYIEYIYVNYQKHFIDDSDNISILSTELKDKEILIIAPGKTIEKYESLIHDFANKANIVPISVNFIPDEFECSHAFISNAKRFESLLEARKLDTLVSKLILTSNIDAYEYDSIKVNYSTLLNTVNAVTDNSVLMLLKLLIKLNVKKVFLAGFDGYSYNYSQNYANRDMAINRSNSDINSINFGIATVLNKYSQKISIEFITPTKYSDMLKFDWLEVAYE
jgi:4-hydroxy 2-oxovalerate aldolase